jgi:hypothetical protein
VNKTVEDWKIYRTRFLVKAKQLTAPLVFEDALGREQRGRKGDYLVESSDGLQSIAPRAIFEDIYVAMGPVGEQWRLPLRQGISQALIGQIRGSSPAS